MIWLFILAVGGHRIVGYLTSYNLYAENTFAKISPYDLTHIKYAFMNISLNSKNEYIAVYGDNYMDAQKFFGNEGFDQTCSCCAVGALYQLWLFKRKYPHLKTLLTIGKLLI